MDVKVNAKQRALIRKRIRAGQSEQEVFDQAMTLLAESDRRLQVVKRDIDKGRRSVRAGRGTLIGNKDELSAFAASVLKDAKTRARRRTGKAA